MRYKLAAGWVCAALVAVSACSGDEAIPASGVWAATTHAFDPECGNCIEVGAGELAHTGEYRILIDVKTDDPPAQWGRCFTSFMDCWDGGGGIDGCVAAAICPQPCKEAYVAQLPAHPDLEQRFVAFEAVFFNDGALCAYPAPPEVSP